MHPYLYLRLHLRVRPAGGARKVAGQVLAPRWAAAPLSAANACAPPTRRAYRASFAAVARFLEAPGEGAALAALLAAELATGTETRVMIES